MSIFLWLALGVCMAAALTDLRKGVIPNALTYPVIALSPVLHVAWPLFAGRGWRDALVEGLFSLLGLAACCLIPYFMWRKNALGGGDLKLFAALGALLLPRLAFEVELYVFIVAALGACGQLAYRGKLFAVFYNAARAVLRFRPSSKQPSSIDPELASWFRLGPCFAFGVLGEFVTNWKIF